MTLGRLWTVEEEAELWRLVDAGTPPNAIAAALGRSQRGIALRMARGRRPIKPESVTFTQEEKALLRAAEFDGHGWLLPDMAQGTAAQLERAHLIERQRGRWYLRPKGFKVRAEIGRALRHTPPTDGVIA